MAFVVEDGTGVATANALVSVEDADTYFADRGNATWGALQAAEKQAAIVRASIWLSAYFRWKGSRVSGRAQGLAWPRSGVVDRDGNAVPVNAVPIEVQRAAFEAALFEAGTPGGLTPTITPSKQTRREKVGPIEREFFEQKTAGRGDVDRIDDSRPVISSVLDHVRDMVTGVYPVPHPATA